MMPSGPHSSTIGTGEPSRVSVTVIRLCGHTESGPRPVGVQSYFRIRAATSPPPAGNDSPDPADPAWSGTSSPQKTTTTRRGKRHDPAFVPHAGPRPPRNILARFGGPCDPSLAIRLDQCPAALLAASLFNTISPSTATPVLALIRNGLTSIEAMRVPASAIRLERPTSALTAEAACSAGLPR